MIKFFRKIRYDLTGKNKISLKSIYFLIFFIVLVAEGNCQTDASSNVVWSHTNGPFGGRFNLLTIDQKGNLYTTTGSFIFQSKNDGKSWQLINRNLSHAGFRCLRIDNNDHLYAGTDSEGIYYSKNYGKTWKQINEGLSDYDIRSINILKNESIIAGTSNGIFISHNKGKSWNKILNNVQVLSVETSQDEIWVATTKQKIIHSNNAGSSWSTISEFENEEVTSLFITPAKNLLIGTNSGKIYKSVDNGVSFSTVYQLEKENQAIRFAIDDENRIYTVVEGPWFSNKGGAMYSSTDEGNTWFKHNDEITKHVTPILLVKDKIYLGTMGVISSKSRDEIKWSHYNNGIIAQRVNDLLFTQQNDLLAGSYDGVFRLNKNKDSWLPLNTGLEEKGVLDMVIDKKGYIYLGTYTSSIYRSIDNGETWVRTSDGLPKKAWMWSLAINKHNDLFVATTGKGIFKSMDSGITWHAINNGLKKLNFYAIGVSPDGVLFAGLHEGGIFRSLDNGNNWEELPSEKLKNITVLEFVFSEDKKIFAGTANSGVFRSDDNGKSWIQVNNGLTTTSIRSLAISVDGILYAGTNGSLDYVNFNGESVFRSDNYGESWTLINKGLFHTRVKALIVDNINGLVYAGTFGGGVFRSSRTNHKK